MIEFINVFKEILLIALLFKRGSAMRRRFMMLSILLGFFLVATIAYAHEWMAPKKEALIKNPVIKNAPSLSIGKNIYIEFCTYCHGNTGKGLNPKAIGLNKKPTNLQKTLKTHSDGDIFWKINTGRNEMPSFKEDLEEKEIWSVIHYIRSF